MDLQYSSESMQNWRKEVEAFLGFELKAPEYDHIAYGAEEYMSPVWDYSCRFYDAQDKLICRLISHDYSLFTDHCPGVPGVPDTWGSDEDWNALFKGQGCPPVFKGFPWNFNLTFFDKQARPTLEIVARRTFQNDSRAMVHMAWYLTRWTYDIFGKSSDSREWGRFDWELNRISPENKA